MKRTIILLIIILWNCFLYAQNTTVIVIGNVHYPSKNYNADTLLGILEKINPDIILLELDSLLFSRTFDSIYQLKYSSKENEPNATAKYLKQHINAIAKPFEFEGRDIYRKEKGIRQSQNLVEKILDSLYKKKLLTRRQNKIVKKYYDLTEILNSYGERNAREFNNAATDKLSKKRQFYQHYKLRKVINQRTEFSKMFVNTSLGEKITLQEGYNRFANFWDLRNKTMANNIAKVAGQNPNKTIVVLTGFFHRYYLIKELEKMKNTLHIKEYF